MSQDLFFSLSISYIDGDDDDDNDDDDSDDDNDNDIIIIITIFINIDSDWCIVLSWLSYDFSNQRLHENNNQTGVESYREFE